jgi:hypothetical protein
MDLKMDIYIEKNQISGRNNMRCWSHAASWYKKSLGLNHFVVLTGHSNMLLNFGN